MKYKRIIGAVIAVICLCIYAILNPTHNVKYVCIDNVKHFYVVHIESDQKTKPKIFRDYIGNRIKCS